MGISKVGAHINPAEQVRVHTRLDINPLVESHRKNTLFVTVASAKVIPHFVVCIGNGNLVVLVDSCPVSFLEPVGFILESVRKRDCTEFVHQFAVFLHIEDFVCACDICESDGSIESNLRSATFLSLFRGYENDTVCCPRTINCRRRRILENLHCLDVLRGEICDCIVTCSDRNAVHDIKRVV